MVQIALGIFLGDEDPVPVAEKIGVVPYDARRKGARKNGKVPLPRQSIVSYTSSALNPDFDQHWANIKHLFFSKQEILREISEAAKIKITIIVDYSDEVPELVFDEHFISFASNINAIVDVDTYDDRDDAWEMAHVDNHYRYHLGLSLEIEETSEEHFAILEKEFLGTRKMEITAIDSNIVLSSTPSDGWDASFEDHWKCFEEELLPKLTLIQHSLCKSIKNINIKVEDICRFPSIYMENNFMRFAQELGASISVGTVRG